MIIFTNAGDTPESIANDCLGHNDAEFAKQIKQANVNSFAWQMMNGCGVYSPYRALWIPGYSIHDDNVALREQLVHRLDFTDSKHRANLTALQNQGVDINHLIGASKAILQSNHDNRAQGQGIVASIGTSVAIESSHRFIERATEPAKKFSDSVKNLNNRYSEFLNSKTPEAREAYYAARRDAQAALNKQAKLYKNIVTLKTRKSIQSAKHMQHEWKKGIHVGDLDDINILSKIGHYGKIAGRGFIAFSIALGVDDVYDTYKNGGDWKAEAAGVSLELVGVATIGALFLGFTPVGWVALAVTALVEGVALTALGEILKEVGKYAEKHVAHWI